MIIDKQKAAIRWSIVGAFGLAFAVILFTWLGGDERERSPTGSYRAEVARVISGHSIKLESDERLNYAAIRTPYKNEPFHEEARQRNAELVEGKKVRLRFDVQDHDGKGRLLAFVSVDGQLVNETLVREGLAYVRLTRDTRRFADRFLAAQAEAREHKRGIWARTSPSSETSYPADPKYGNFHRPTCEESPKINPARLVTFDNKSQAFDAGYAPCTKCSP